MGLGDMYQTVLTGEVIFPKYATNHSPYTTCVHFVQWLICPDGGYIFVNKNTHLFMKLNVVRN